MGVIFMRISAINCQSNPHFAGEKSAKNKLRDAAGAAAIALAAAAPANEADAQYFYPPPVYPYTYYVPAQTVTTVPNCFVVGDLRNYDREKSMREVFTEIDANGNENGLISAKEVLRTERNNWNLNNLTPYTTTQMRNTEEKFNAISKMYNEDDSDPYTLNYREYKAVMKDYMETKEVNSFINLWQILPMPGFYPPPLHPHHHRHHHHDYRPAPPPVHNFHRPHEHKHSTPPHRHEHRHW